MLGIEYVFAYFADWASGIAHVFYRADVFWKDTGTGKAFADFSRATHPYYLFTAYDGYADANSAVAVGVANRSCWS